MAQQIINIGSAPNDGTGDQLRISFDKCNTNFTELYNGVTASLPIGNAIQYQFNNSTTEPPAAGEIRLNNATQASATKLWASHTTSSGINIKQFLSAATTGSVLILQDKNDNTNFLKLNVTGAPVDKTTYWEFSVTVTASGGNLPNAAILAAVTAAASSVDLSAYAPLASPTFTGDPKAPTPTAGDNDTTIATTAFVTAAVAAAGGSSITPPQGRLTLQSATPVMVTTQAAKTTIYWTPYVGNLIPIYNGSAFAMMASSEISAATTDTSKNPSAIGASKVNDWFVWNDSGTIRLSHGPDWTDDVTRSAGTALVRVGGFLLNNASITNACAAQRGTYVGTTRSNASSQLDWIYGGIGAGGVAGFFGVWNAYNRRLVTSLVGESVDQWTYNSNTPRAANGSTSMRHSFVCGLAEDNFEADYSILASNTNGAIAGICYDVTNAFSGRQIATFVSPSPNGVSGWFATTAIGFHFFQAGEAAGPPAAATFWGDNGNPSLFQSGIVFKGWM